MGLTRRKSGGINEQPARSRFQRARERGYAAMQFNAVAASNSAAIRLYERHGFAIVGTVPGGFDHPRLGRVGLHIMYCGFN